MSVEPDDHTDSTLAVYKGNTLSEPRRPGRGQGCADVPGLKVIIDVDPNDVAQGAVGDCWLLRHVYVGCSGMYVLAAQACI